MENNYYVYGYYRFDTDSWFYIGKGHENRCYYLYDRSPHFTNIINRVRTAVVILADNLTKEQAFEYEKQAIETLVFEYGYSIDIQGNYSLEEGYHLVNATWGGDGVSNGPLSEDHKRKIGEANIGKNIGGEHGMAQAVITKDHNDDIIDEYEAISVALDTMGLPREYSGNISACCSGRGHTIGGVKWVRSIDFEHEYMEHEDNYMDYEEDYWDCILTLSTKHHYYN